MRTQLFHERISRAGAAGSFLALVAMVVLYTVLLPDILLATAGQLFAILWVLMASIALLAHADRIRQPGLRNRALPIEKMRSSLPVTATRRYNRSRG